MVEARYKHAWCVAAQQQQQQHRPWVRRLLNIAGAAVAVAFDGSRASLVRLTIPLAACLATPQLLLACISPGGANNWLLRDIAGKAGVLPC